MAEQQPNDLVMKNLDALLHDEEFIEVMNNGILNKLINDEEVVVGKSPEGLGEVEEYYVKRTVSRQLKLEKEQMKKDQTFFIVRRKNFNEKISEDKELLLISDDETFESLCKRYPNHNIHLLDKNETGEVSWKKSRRNLSKLRKFVDANSTSEFSLTEIKDKVVIISGDSGMGKSTLVTKLVSEIKDEDPTVWIERINLNDCTAALKESEFGDITTAIDFLLNLQNLVTPLEKLLFKRRVLGEGKIQILFDGFDEISSYCKKKVIKLILLLRDAKVSQILITTRPNSREKLENALSVFSYTMQPFSQEDQEMFLKMFWSKKLGIDIEDDTRISSYINELLSLMKHSATSQEPEIPDLTGTALHTKMLAEVFEAEFKQFYDSQRSTTDLPSTLNIVDLYRLFTEKKYEMYSVEKKEELPCNADVKEDEKDSFRNFIRRHKLLALNFLFNENDIRKLLVKRERDEMNSLIERVAEGNEKTGLINKFRNNRVHFIHTTFVEYFAALWFSENLKRKQVKFFYYDRIKNDEGNNFKKFEVFQLFFYFMTTLTTESKEGKNKFSIHGDVLSCGVEKDEELVEGGSAEIETPDGEEETVVYHTLRNGYAFIDFGNPMFMDYW